MRIVECSILILASSIILASAVSAAPELTTLSERTDFRQTGRYEEVERLCAAFAAAYPKNVRSVRFGTTPEGRPMLALIASRGGALDPKAAKAKQKPVLLFQGGIHAGEIDGKDAGFLALRHLLDGTIPGNPLANVTVVFVPVFNIDGHERFGPNNRPNQRGPESMGWRTSAQNLNLNRDYMKADAPEMVAMLKLLREWDPIVYVDMHVTDGAKFQQDIAVMIQPSLVGPEALRLAGAQMSATLMANLAAAGNLPTWFYPSFDQPENPASGITVGLAPPRFSDGYWAARNRIGVLVETHSWHDYKARVRSTFNTIITLVNQAAKSGPDWLRAAGEADAESTAIAGKLVTLAWKATEEARAIDFLGYDYQRVPSDISGQLWTRYDETKPAVWKMSLRATLVPALQIEAPQGGYIVPAAHAAWVARLLDLHGIRSMRMIAGRELPANDLQLFRLTKLTPATSSFEGRREARVEGAWISEARAIPPGSLFVPIAQPLARLVMHLLEPTAPDSLVSWGFFNGSFEQKEYMEAYVAEEAAREMLARDPKLKEAFDARLKADAAFTASPAQRLEFFVRRHATHDERLNLYPIYRSRIVPAK